jgi:tripartite ATP-independent transporter DctM subunit
VWGVALLFLIVIGSIFFGIATPTEAGALGAFAALVMVTAQRRLGWNNFIKVLLDTGSLTGMVFFIIIGANLFSVFITQSGLSAYLVETIAILPVPPLLLLILILLLYVPLEMFLDVGSMLLVTLPIIFPIIAELGFNGIWFGILVVKMCEIGMITPPLGMNVYVLKGVAAHVPVGDIWRGITWFLAIDFATLAVLIAFPQIVLWLPAVMWG